MRSFVVLLVLLVASVVSAAPKKKAPKASGGSGAKQAVVVDAPPAMAKLLQSTLSTRFNVTINRDALSDAPTSKEVRSVTSPAKALAVVLARPAGDAWTVTVLNGADGTPLETQNFRAAARKPLKALPKNVAGALILACATGQAPAAPAAPVNDPPKSDPKPEPTKVEPVATPTKSTPKKDVVVAAKEPEPEPATSVSTPSSSPSSSPSALPAIRAGLGFRAFGRSLTWSGDPDQALARYALPFAPAVALDATWYPGAHFTSGVAANLGIAFSGDIGVGISSKQDTSRFGTRYDRFRVSGAFRQPFGSTFSLEAVAGFSTQTFSIDPVAANDGSARPNIPSVTFNGPRAGLGVRLVKLGPVGIDAMAGFTFLAWTGELGTEAYFKRAGGFGIDAGGGVSIELVENVQVRAGLDWTRYILSLRPEEGARFTAPSAADQYLGGSVALHWVM